MIPWGAASLPGAHLGLPLTGRQRPPPPVTACSLLPLQVWAGQGGLSVSLGQVHPEVFLSLPPLRISGQEDPGGRAGDGGPESCSGPGRDAACGTAAADPFPHESLCDPERTRNGWPEEEAHR